MTQYLLDVILAVLLLPAFAIAGVAGQFAFFGALCVIFNVVVFIFNLLTKGK